MPSEKFQTALLFMFKSKRGRLKRSDGLTLFLCYQCGRAISIIWLQGGEFLGQEIQNHTVSRQEKQGADGELK